LVGIRVIEEDALELRRTCNALGSVLLRFCSAVGANKELYARRVACRRVSRLAPIASSDIGGYLTSFQTYVKAGIERYVCVSCPPRELQ